jgi:aminoglycoside 3'-phosphotransferase-2
MTELVGQQAAGTLIDDPVYDTVAAIAAGCQRLHAADATGFPFVEDVSTLLEQAKNRIERGLVDTADFDDERLGRTADDLFEELCRVAPGACDVVLTHGDLGLPNIILRQNDGVGFVDVGRAAVSDRWRDLALCLRSIEHDWGREWADEYLRLYGVARDEGRVHFYTLLDEFF